MAEELVISKSTDKTERYAVLLPQIGALVEGEEDVIANLSNITAALREAMNFFWVGFYLAKKGELVLVEASPKAYVEKARAPIMTGINWAMPAVANGKCYLQNDKAIVAVDLRG